MNFTFDFLSLLIKVLVISLAFLPFILVMVVNRLALSTVTSNADLWLAPIIRSSSISPIRFLFSTILDRLSMETLLGIISLESL